MIDNRTLDTLYTEGTQAFLSFRISEGLEYLEALMLECDDQQLASRLNAIRLDYDSMLTFLGHGGRDDKHQDIQRSISCKALSILDATHRQVRIRYGKGIYAQTAKGLSAGNSEDRFTQLTQEWETRQDSPARFPIQDQLFDLLWTMGAATPSFTASLYAFLSGQPKPLRQHLTAGIFLSCWEYFDTEKITLLKLMTEDEDLQVRTFALTGYALLCHRHALRFNLYGERFEAQGKDLPDELTHIQKALFVTKQSEYIRKELDKKLYPQLMKEAEKYMTDKLGIDNSEKTMTILDKVREMGTDGVDLNAGNYIFAHRDAFFQQPSHWLAPFEIDRPEVTAILYDQDHKQKKNVIDLITLNAKACDCDRYSFIFLLSALPKDLAQKLEGRKGNPLKGLFGDDENEDDTLRYDNEDKDKEEGIDLSQHVPCWTTEEMYRATVQHLYRLFSMSPWRGEMQDPFEKQSQLLDCPLLSDSFTSSHRIEISRLMLKYKGEGQALRHIIDIIHQEGATAELLRMQGDCHRALTNYPAAISAYVQADLLEEDEQTLDNLQQCLKQVERYAEQEECLLRLRQIDATSDRYFNQLALCYMTQEKYEEALKLFYQMEYEGRNAETAMRAIAWCSFKLNRLENARKQYAKILGTPKTAKWEDYLNAGHTEWCLGNWAGAVESYRTYIPLYQKSHPDDHSAGIAPYDADRAELLSHGINEQDFQLMRDIILKKE